MAAPSGASRLGGAGTPPRLVKLCPVLRLRQLHGYHEVAPPIALIAPFARVSRSTNRSTPHQGDSRMSTTESYRRLELRCQGYGRRATWSIWTTRRSSSIVEKTRYRPVRRRTTPGLYLEVLLEYGSRRSGSSGRPVDAGRPPSDRLHGVDKQSDLAVAPGHSVDAPGGATRPSRPASRRVRDGSRKRRPAPFPRPPARSRSRRRRWPAS
jgi:hypothetical protein